MFVRTFLGLRFRKGYAATAAVAASLAMTASAMAQVQAAQFAPECALKEIAVLIVIEDHGAAGDLPADRLADAGLKMLRARSACYEGRVVEALALYESSLDLARQVPGPATTVMSHLAARLRAAFASVAAPPSLASGAPRNGGLRPTSQ
jgi:hypothetical protein